MELEAILEAFKPLAKALAILAAFVFLGVLLDYLSGSIAARINNEWSSKVARQGIWHKVGIFLCIIVAALLDALIIVASKTALNIPISYSGFFAPLVEVMFIITEFCSILENLGKMGVPIPKFLIRGISAFHHAVKNEANNILPNEGEDKEEEDE